MLYSVYKKINADEFLYLKAKIETAERLASPIMQSRDFYLNRDGYANEYLGLHYLTGNYFKGNIGVQYDEENSLPHIPLFIFYILKAMEKKGILYYKKINLNRNYSMEEISINCIRLFEELICLLFYLQNL